MSVQDEHDPCLVHVNTATWGGQVLRTGEGWCMFYVTEEKEV